jgi:hypothetical protein
MLYLLQTELFWVASMFTEFLQQYPAFVSSVQYCGSRICLKCMVFWEFRSVNNRGNKKTGWTNKWTAEGGRHFYVTLRNVEQEMSFVTPYQRDCLLWSVLCEWSLKYVRSDLEENTPSYAHRRNFHVLRVRNTFLCRVGGILSASITSLLAKPTYLTV